MQKIVKVIGAGLAGSEAAYQLSKFGFKVKLYEQKIKQKNEIQKIDDFCELVCSNTFRSISIENAVGILKEELKLLDSLIIKTAINCAIPGDDALSVDRIKFSSEITNYLRNDKNIEIIDEEFCDIQETEPIIIASGPLTSYNLQNSIQELIGKSKFFYLDASAPIVKKESINFKKVYFKSRHGNDDEAYICVPLDEIEFNNFVDLLINAKNVKLKDFEKEVYFKGCQPIEKLAKESKKLLLSGPMSPNNLNNEKFNPYAVVQLRRDNAKDDLYNIVGFQTNLTWPEQQRILSTLPGLENIDIQRYGVLHKNNYINSPKILNKKLQVMRNKEIFFAGQITGVEGYVESCASGIVAAYGMRSYLLNKKFSPFPSETVIGSLINYITNPKHRNFKPMKANIGIMPTLPTKYKTKSEKNLEIYRIALSQIKKFITEN